MIDALESKLQEHFYGIPFVLSIKIWLKCALLTHFWSLILDFEGIVPKILDKWYTFCGIVLITGKI
jgi:hypothetical protein